MRRLFERLLDFIFPKFCFGCKKEGTFLCEDCLEVVDIFKEQIKFRDEFLDDLFAAAPYSNFLLKRLILALKYEPFVKDLAKELAKILISHLKILEKDSSFSNFLLLPVPLDKKRMRWRGFNQSEEIGKEIAKELKIQLISDCLIKVKHTFPQVELKEEERRKNLKDAFLVKKKEIVLGREILLIDDVFTTGTTLRECAKVLKKAGAKKVIGLVVAIAKPGEDKFQKL